MFNDTLKKALIIGGIIILSVYYIFLSYIVFRNHILTNNIANFLRQQIRSAQQVQQSATLPPSVEVKK